ncbi:ribonuclease H-like domain-containing protein [Tanacetum coccineum]|uniref:Ribonuclease H-like domain-containing protein n=1 Tax=Tanacetum coccineum TaxID=301880 RepID=A0ABQ5D1X1_9ASTR
MDTGASSHLNSSASNLSTIFNQRLFPSVHVGDGNSIPVTNTGHSIIPSLHRPLHLHNVIVTPNIIKNLIYVRQFTRDNNCTIEFDAFGFSVKDFRTRHILLRCDSSDDLYPVTKPSTSHTAFLSTSASTWHQRLGHPGDKVLRSLVSRRFISCNKEKAPHLCHACQLGKHVKLPFHSSDSIVENCFDIIHTDLWTSPIDSSCGFKYYVLFLDNFSHYLWIYPLLSKSDMFDKFLHFRTYVKNQFKCEIKSFQCDHGDPQWRNAMYDEYNALVKYGTWLLVPRPDGVNMVRSMWLFKHKFHADGTLSRYKARLVANGSSQQLGVDFDKTFSPVVKLATIRTVLSLVVSRQWLIHQLDVKNAFLNGDLSETMYMHLVLLTLGYATRAGFDHIRCDSSLFICRQDSQRKYALQLLERAHMVNCNPSRTPVDTNLTLPALKRILRNVQGTMDFGLQLYASATTSLVGYTDADWAGCPSTRRSTSGYCVFLGDNLLSWSAKRQHTLSRSSAEAEYRGVANVVAETAWLRNLLRELHSPLSTATLVYCDNVSAVYMSANPVQHQRTKHIEIDIHFVRDMVTAGQVRVLHVPSRYQYADIFTKGLPSALFEEFRSSLSVHPPPAPTAGAY